MKRKRPRDVREYWPWYERSWPSLPFKESRAVPPPFELDEIRVKPQAQLSGRTRARMWIILAMAVLCLSIAWALLHQ